MPTRRIAVVAGDAHPDAAFVAETASISTTLADYRPALAEAARQGATLAVLPERIALIPEDGEDAALAAWSAMAVEFHLDLVVGLADGAGTARRNRAWYIDAEGRRIVDYAKRHLVPGLEDAFTPGDRSGAAGSMTVAICKDLDFEATGLEAAERGDALLLAPAWDFVRDAELHARLARTRALEGGFTLVRSARQGLAGIYDRRGRVLAEAPSAIPAAVRVVDVPVSAERTVFARVGRHLGPLYLVVTLLLAWTGWRRSSPVAISA
jgi:apolipoprotein N-acyltransferase